MPLFLRIRKSKRLSRKALKLAYTTIEKFNCTKYSYIVDRIIELELRLGNISNAEKIALERLNNLNPNWQEFTSPVYSSHLSVLATIISTDGSNSFYKRVRRNRGNYGCCGTTSYTEDVSILSWQAEKLYLEYGKIYCLKFLKSSTILISEDDERAKPYWDNIYKLLIQSMEIEYTYEQIKKQFESSTIEKKELDEWEKETWVFDFQRSQYYLEIMGVNIFFKTDDCSSDKNRFKRCQPEDCTLLKFESDLYKKISEYAL